MSGGERVTTLPSLPYLPYLLLENKNAAHFPTTEKASTLPRRVRSAPGHLLCLFAPYASLL